MSSQKSVDQIRDEYLAKLEKVSGLSRDQAKQELIAEVEKDSHEEIAKIIKLEPLISLGKNLRLLR